MAHNLSIREDGFVEFGFTGSRNNIWHSLGNQIEDDETLDVWKVKSGMDWEICETEGHFFNTHGLPFKIPDHKILYRSDNNSVLAIVSSKFKVVQPKEIIEFFEDLISINGMKMSSAGTLFGGKKFWALAETGSDVAITQGDVIKGNILLVTATDGTMATTASVVSTRVVCDNTLNIALKEKSKNIIKKSHRNTFDAKQVKIDMGLIQESWSGFVDSLKKLSEREMSSIEVKKFFEKTFFDPEAEEQDKSVSKKVDELIYLYNFGDGASLCQGTALGALNAVTNLFTHGTGRSSVSSQFMKSYLGRDAKIKEQVFEDLLEIC